MIIYFFYYIIALFSFTSLVYDAVERTNAMAEVIVQLERGNLTAATQVTVETVDGGTATGILVYCNVAITYTISVCNSMALYTYSGC